MRNEPPDRVRVVGLPGSLRDGSYSRAATRIALEGAAAVGADTDLIDLREYDLVPCPGKLPDADAPPDVMRLRHQLRDANGIILATPEYHGAMSGVLKNALDLTGWSEFEGKMLGLIGVAGGAMGGMFALNELRTIGRVLHAWVIPEQAAIGRVSDQFDDAGGLKDPKLDERVRLVGRQVAQFARLHNAEQSRAFLEEWEHAAENPGG